MNIKASCQFNYESIKAFIHLSMFRKANPKKRIVLWSVMYAVLVSVIAFEIILLGADLILLILLGICLIILLYNLFSYFLLPNIRYKALGKIKNTVNEYVFSDDSLIVKSEGDEFNGESTFKYTMFTRVWETSEYLFIYQNKSQAFIVDKSTISNGGLEEIRVKFSSVLGNQYIVCNY